MTLRGFDWKAALEKLFSATVNQQTFEEAAELMVSVSVRDRSYHEECMVTFEEAVRAAESGDNSIIECINKSGYRAATLEDAIELLRDFRCVYLDEYRRTIS